MDHPRPPPRHHAGGRGGLHASIPGGGGGGSDERDLKERERKTKGLRGGGLEKMKRYLANLSFVEMSVVKATSATDGPPKRKHTSRLVEEMWRDPQIAPVEAMNALGRVPMLNSPLISLKVLATCHELMQKGSPSVLTASYEFRDHFVMLDKHWTAAVAGESGGDNQTGGGYVSNNAGYGLGQLCAGLVVAYARALLKKTRFHEVCGGFENNYSFPGATGESTDRHKCASLQSLTHMLQLGKTLRNALDVVTGALPRNPPLAALQWHRLVAHVGTLVAVEAHLLHGASVFIAAKIAGSNAGGLPASSAREISMEHEFLRQAFAEARARPAIKTAFMEEGGDGTVGNRGRRGAGENDGRGGSFSFLELPDKLPDFASDGGKDAMASVMASSFGPPSSHQRPSVSFVENAVSSPFDECNSDDDLAAATEREVGGATERETQPTIDLPPLIDFEAEEDLGCGWEQTRPAMVNAPPPPRPPLFGGYGISATPQPIHFPQPNTNASGSFATPNAGGFTSAVSSFTGNAGHGSSGAYGSGYGSPGGMVASMSASKMNQRARSPCASPRETVLDIDASLAAFELTAARPTVGRERKVDGAAPLMFADLAPAGVSSVRVAPAPRSMIAQRGGDARGGHTQVHSHHQHPALARTLSGGLPQFTTEQVFQQQQQQQQQHTYQQYTQPWAKQDTLSGTNSPPPPGSTLHSGAPQDWAKFDDSATTQAPRGQHVHHVHVQNQPAPRVHTHALAPNPITPLVPVSYKNQHPSAPSGANVFVPMPVAKNGLEAGRPARGGVEHQTPTPGPAFDEIPIGAIAFGKRVGTGAFGEVLKATYQGTDVAVKRLRLDPSQPQAAEDFRRELAVLCGLRHRHVVQVRP
jgi:hypothetical protein